ncbi:MAG: electron transfer flavoprotein subunit alpha/FixB family protein [Tepidanaerobacteraceae bacterium]|jgi:electron transfer flavoprotein alpha subunit
MKIFVYAEQENGKLLTVVSELLGEARRLAKSAGIDTEISTILLGSQVTGLTNELISLGADKVYLADSPELEIYSNQTYSKLVTHIIKQQDPDIFLVGATAKGSELAPTVGCQLCTGVAAHCVELKLSPEGRLIQVVPSFGGKVMGEIICPNNRPQMATIKPGVLEKSSEDRKNRHGQVINIDTRDVLKDFISQITPIEVNYEPPKGKPLETAEVVIAGGWGIGSKEDWKMIEQLAEALGAAVGCTRPAVDEGWAPGEHVMIGTSGKTIKPKVYIGIGISGATHHICGMKDSGIIISINKDPQASIFEVSDLKVVGDFKEIVPILLNKIKT